MFTKRPFLSWVFTLIFAMCGTPTYASIFDVEALAHSSIKNLPTPQMWPELGITPFPITTKSLKTKKHFEQGMAHLQAAWDFEAYRHFYEAIRNDSNCIMAYWGISLSLTSPNSELNEIRILAINRLRELIAKSDATEREKNYAHALDHLYASDGKLATNVFELIAKNNPDDLYAQIMSVFFKRDGYSQLGTPGEQQKKTIKKIEYILDRAPMDQTVLSYWTILHAEHPDVKNVLRRKPLLVARYLTEISPTYPPYHHIRGNFEYRCGNLHLAQHHLKKAVELYALYMKNTKVEFYDCPGWLQSQICLAYTHYWLGEANKAIEIAKQISSLNITQSRLNSRGAAIALWEGRTLAPRLYLTDHHLSDFTKALASLPSKKDMPKFLEKDLSTLYLESLRNIILGRNALAKSNTEQCKQSLVNTSRINHLLRKNISQTTKTTSFDLALRALQAIDTYATQLRGYYSNAGPNWKKGTASNWFLSAISKQPGPSILMPTPIPEAMEQSLAHYYLKNKQPEKAIESCEEALIKRPNGIPLLRLLQQSQEKAKLLEKSQETQDLIQKVIKLPN